MLPGLPGYPFQSSALSFRNRQGHYVSARSGSEPLNDAPLKIRVGAKAEVRKALVQASKILQDGARELAEEALHSDD